MKQATTKSFGGSEGGLGASEVAESTTVGRSTSSSTTASTSATATTIAKAASTTATSAKAAASAITEASTPAATSATALEVTRELTRLAEVDTHGTSLEIVALHGIERSLGLIDGRERDVAKALGSTSLAVGGKTDAVDGTKLLECLRNAILVDREAEIADPQSVARVAGLITICLGSDLRVLAGLILAGSSEVDIDAAPIDLSTLLRGMGLGSIVSTGKFDVRKSSIVSSESGKSGRGSTLWNDQYRDQ